MTRDSFEPVKYTKEKNKQTKKKKKKQKKKLEMCPQYTDVPALGISIKLCKPCKLAYVNAGWGGGGGGGGRICVLWTHF